MTKPHFFLAQLGVGLVLSLTTAQSAAGGVRTIQVHATETSLRSGQTTPVRFTCVLPSADKVTAQVFDPDSALVRTIIQDVPRPKGGAEFAWDGKDASGQFVPDEAYTLVVTTASGAYSDPITFSGGEIGDITTARVDTEAGTITYSLPVAARVLIRVGVKNGPMLRTVVDWKPRPAGVVTDYWDGWDSDHTMNVAAAGGYSILITYIGLPANTVITYGNTSESYRDYKLGRGKVPTLKPSRPPTADKQGKVTSKGLVRRAWERSPRILMSFPDHKGPDLVLSKKARPVRLAIDVDPLDREQILNDQFEIIFFVDRIFFAEAERGYLPFNWIWELDQLPVGDHVLTVNISSFSGQVGVASRKVRILN